MKIDYNIPPLHQTEADVRLADAMLFAALKQTLDEKIEPYSSLYPHSDDRPLWGPDPFFEDRVGLHRRQAAYRNKDVLEALGGGTAVSGNQIQAEMDRLSADGIGTSMRNMKDPAHKKRFLEPGAEFSSQASAIEATLEDTVLIHPHYQTLYERRYLVVAGQIAGETPLFFCDENPLLLLDPGNRTRQCARNWGALEEGNPEWIACQRNAVEDLLSKIPMASGSIEVGLVPDKKGAMLPRILEVTPARPGSVDILFADPVAYAEMIARHLPEIEPRFSGEDSPEFLT